MLRDLLTQILLVWPVGEPSLNGLIRKGSHNSPRSRLTLKQSLLRTEEQDVVLSSAESKARLAVVWPHTLRGETDITFVVVP